MFKAEQILHNSYQLKELLGQNTGRQTWLAEDITCETKQRVIVKLLAINPQTNWQDLKLFEREAQVLENLNHSRIPKYYDYFSLNEQEGFGLPRFGLVQDYIPGISLQERLKKSHQISLTEVRYYAEQILHILIYLHELSPPVLHRDIKPSNLILGKEGKIYLVDFGAVQDRVKAEGATFTVVGTSGYVPPEQLWGKAIPASDLYALGATLIHLLTGISPADLPQQQMKIQFHDQVKLNYNFVNWLEKLTAPATEKRFNSAREGLTALPETLLPVAESKTVNHLTSNLVNYGRLAILSFSGVALSLLVACSVVYILINQINQPQEQQENLKPPQP